MFIVTKYLVWQFVWYGAHKGKGSERKFENEVVDVMKVGTGVNMTFWVVRKYE